MKRFNLLSLALLLVLAISMAAPRIQAQTAETETLTISDTTCTTTTPCTAQLYRITGACATPTTTIPSGYTELAASLTAATTTSTSSTFTYSDSTPVVGTQYCYLATVTYVTGGKVSSPSVGYSMLIPYPTPASPFLTGSPY
ncbi:MAG: hypothetical protein M1396_01275 [Chloroflexi bacterium]|nr:hypothetical protein [Chloroflexota bacterium]